MPKVRVHGSFRITPGSNAVIAYGTGTGVRVELDRGQLSAVVQPYGGGGPVALTFGSNGSTPAGALAPGRVPAGTTLTFAGAGVCTLVVGSSYPVTRPDGSPIFEGGPYWIAEVTYDGSIVLQDPESVFPFTSSQLAQAATIDLYATDDSENGPRRPG